MNLIRQFNYFLYEYVETRIPETTEQVDKFVEEYYENFKKAVELGE